MKRRLVSLILVLVLAACVLPAQAASGTLRRGSRGTAVTQLQTALKELGLYTIKVDGIYGRGTVAAVKSYQRKNGLVADGIAGPKTLGKLYGGGTPAAPAPASVRIHSGFRGSPGCGENRQRLPEAGKQRQRGTGPAGEALVSGVLRRDDHRNL